MITNLLNVLLHILALLVTGVEILMAVFVAVMLGFAITVIVKTFLDWRSTWVK